MNETNTNTNAAGAKQPAIKGYVVAFTATLDLHDSVTATTTVRATTKRAAISAAKRRCKSAVRDKANWANKSFDGHMELMDCELDRHATDYGRVSIE